MMNKRTQFFFLPGLVVFAGLLLAACQPKPQVITPAVPGISVTISGNICPGVEVQVGNQVTWTNQDSREHVVRHIPEEGNSQFSSGVLNPQDSFSFTFLEPGTFFYNCSENSAERATVIVEP